MRIGEAVARGLALCCVLLIAVLAAIYIRDPDAPPWAPLAVIALAVTGQVLAAIHIGAGPRP